ncbi:MAG TPA: BlaI/MecI/CopY family transcriptional regulator [Hyphomicrobiales bacterium]|nr:BlaI/MecI/CopY family transcriptional regulator [Hyphomicrobiales bacterium]
MNLSNLELDVMRLIWRDKEVIAPDLHRELEKDRDLSYSTVKTIVDRLEEKGAIGRIRTYGRTILYGPLIQEKELAKPMVKDLLRRLFAGEALPMISHLVKDEALSLDDLAYLEKIIAQKRKDLEQ